MKSLLRIALIATALLQFAFAQSKGAPVTGSGGSGGGISGGVSTPIAFYGNVVNGPVAGPDGNAYVIRTTTVTTTTPITTKMELVSVGSANTGTINWALQINGTFVSLPAFGAAGSGLIFLTTSEPQFLPLANASTQAAVKLPSFLIISATSSSASITHTVSINASSLTAAQVSPDGQTIYFIGQTSPFVVPVATPGTTSSVTPASATLYAYSTTGTLKNSVKLY